MLYSGFGGEVQSIKRAFWFEHPINAFQRRILKSHKQTRAPQCLHADAVVKWPDTGAESEIEMCAVEMRADGGWKEISETLTPLAGTRPEGSLIEKKGKR